MPEITKLYKDVFAGPPWFEFAKCVNCGINYGEAELTANRCNCKSCSQELKLEPFCSDEQIQSTVLNAVGSNCFIGILARDLASNKRLSFSWGFQVPSVDAPTVKFEQVNELISSKGLIREDLFYSAETGVLPEFQRIGLGTLTSFKRLQIAKDSGFDGVVFRTINPGLVRVYEKLFGRVDQLFNDPEESKKDRMWFYCSFNDFLR